MIQFDKMREMARPKVENWKTFGSTYSKIIGQSARRGSGISANHIQAPVGGHVLYSVELLPF